MKGSSSFERVIKPKRPRRIVEQSAHGPYYLQWCSGCQKYLRVTRFASEKSRYCQTCQHEQYVRYTLKSGKHRVGFKGPAHHGTWWHRQFKRPQDE